VVFPAPEVVPAMTRRAVTGRTVSGPGPRAPGDTRAMPVRRIVPNLHAREPAAARAFYADLLGLEVVMDHGWIATLGVPGREAVQLSVMGDDATAPVAPDVSIEVDDVDAVHAEAVWRGLEIVHPLTDEPWGVRRFFVRDPTGAVVNVLGHP
jgi:catechol 2,3-dioxygenase-like lactoylglutathione lyase family enzyme